MSGKPEKSTQISSGPKGQTSDSKHTNAEANTNAAAWAIHQSKTKQA